MIRNQLAIGMCGLWLVVASACTTNREEYRPRAIGAPVAHNAVTSHPAASGEMSASVDTRDPESHAQAGALERRLREAPRDTIAIMELARLFESSLEWEQAARYYRQLLTITRANRDAAIGLARVYVALENWDAAEAGITSLLAVSPDDAEAMYLLGAIHANRGDYATARTWWRKVERQLGDPQLAKRAAQSLHELAGSPS